MTYCPRSGSLQTEGGSDAQLARGPAGPEERLYGAPSVDRYDQPIEQEYWVTESLSVFGRLFGGATAFPQGRGVWRDDARGGQLIFDAPVIVQCYTTEPALEENAEDLRSFLLRLGKDGRQGAVGFVIDRDYLEIRFPLEEA